MLILENIKLALAGLKANIMRTLLTMLGIIIGIASVIAIMTVGNSVTSEVSGSMQDLGANNLTVGVTAKALPAESTAEGLNFGSGQRRSMTSNDYITNDMIDDFREKYADNIKYITISSSVDSGTATNRDLYAYVSITGANNDYLAQNDIDLLAGRLFLDRDQDEARKVCLVSDYFVDNMFEGDKNAALGQPINVSVGNRYYTYYIVGVYKYDNSYSFSMASKKDTTTTLYLPLSTAKAQTHSEDGYTQIQIVTTTDTDNESFSKQVNYFFNVYYANNKYYEITVASMASLLESLTSMLNTISVALSIIAGISLVVGGIGVMNIMLVSITERTKEIGTRKALGATNASIRLQFITESIVICTIGGIIGIFLGLLMGAIAMKVMDATATPSLESILIAVGFSMLIGVFFGYYPANKAAKLNPIDALRYE